MIIISFIKFIVLMQGLTVNEGLYMTPCESISSLPDFHLDLGGRILTLRPIDYTLQRTYISASYSSYCILGFMPMDRLILGGENCHRAYYINHQSLFFADVWIRQFYTIFDAEAGRVGFAPVKKSWFFWPVLMFASISLVLMLIVGEIFRRCCIRRPQAVDSHYVRL